MAGKDGFEGFMLAFEECNSRGTAITDSDLKYFTFGSTICKYSLFLKVSHGC